LGRALARDAAARRRVSSRARGSAAACGSGPRRRTAGHGQPAVARRPARESGTTDITGLFPTGPDRSGLSRAQTCGRSVEPAARAVKGVAGRVPPGLPAQPGRGRSGTGMGGRRQRTSGPSSANSVGR
jgi:hypothetical protein